MNEENENQPVPLQTESAMPEQRQHRPRRRFPRRRYRNRGGRFGSDNSNESPGAAGDTGVQTLDQTPSGGPEVVEAEAQKGGTVPTETEVSARLIGSSG